MSKFVQIYWTCGNVEEARAVSKELVSNKLVACAHILPQIESVFIWDHQLQSAQEITVIFKTKASLFHRVKDKILALATYEVPEILQIPIVDGNPSYLKWVQETVCD
ncbi:MAG: divalent-cation tolerance protein CutA [Verrucomicrobia bacterium]|nr:divalent-cation tolerance protein CutA [Verrucomicrobiota bacterium]MBS0645095.1 divalent-cation tolerance protein CutA [Verrucomicrobiota bacterium]